MSEPFREEAFLVCQGSGGELVAGNRITGSDSGVTFPTHCPVGTKPLFPFHTHPSDNNPRPSEADVRASLSRGFDRTAVGFQGDVWIWHLAK